MNKKQITDFENTLIKASCGKDFEITKEKYFEFPNLSSSFQYGMFDTGSGSITGIQIKDNQVKYYWSFWNYGWYPASYDNITEILGKIKKEDANRLLLLMLSKMHFECTDKEVQKTIDNCKKDVYDKMILNLNEKISKLLEERDNIEKIKGKM